MFQFCDICGYKKSRTTNFFSSLLLLFLDPGWIKIRIRNTDLMDSILCFLFFEIYSVPGPVPRRRYNSSPSFLNTARLGQLFFHCTSNAQYLITIKPRTWSDKFQFKGFGFPTESFGLLTLFFYGTGTFLVGIPSSPEKILEGHTVS